jgi:TolB-like protein/Tfp pilus assembly protein PilF
VDFELGVNRCIRQLRAALLDDGDTPRYIETIPRRGYRFIAAVTRSRAEATQVVAAAAPSKPAVSEASIAVLPFANLSGNPEDEYFSDGLAEEIINALAQIDGLKVISRTSAFAFKGKNEDIRKIAETLHVSTVLEGSVRRSGNRIRVTAQLIRASDGGHLSSKRYDREMTDVFAIQDEISADIAGQLSVRFNAPARAATNLAAYEAVLEGRFHWRKFTPPGFQRALKCFGRAVAIDPNYGPAYGGMAETYLYMVIDAGASGREFLPKAADAARRAIGLDPLEPNALAALAVVVEMLDYDWAEAERLFRRSRELHGGSHVRNAYASWFLLPRGRFEEAIAECDRMIDQDPLFVAGRTAKATALLFSRNYDTAAEWCLRALELDPAFPRAIQGLAYIRGLQGRHAEALELSDRLLAVLGPTHLSLFTAGLANSAAGNGAATIQAIDQIEELPGGSSGSPTAIGCMYALLDQKQKAVEWLEAAVAHRDPRVIWMNTHPWVDGLRAEPRFQALLRTMNFSR